MKRNSRIFGPLLVLMVLIVGGYMLVRNAHFPWFQPSGVIAAHERTLFIFTVLLSLVVVIPVFTMLIVFAFKFRAGNTEADYQPEWSKNTWLEVLWWGIPIAIIVVLATTVWFTTHALDPYKKIASHNKTLQVQVVALEWKWLFIYPDQHIATVNQLNIPVDTPVHFTLSADAPMSAFWVPGLGSQIYSMNGMSSQLNLMATKTGTLKGYNTNINGEGYAKMNFDVPVMSQNAFSSWTQKMSKEKDTLSLASYDALAKPSVLTKPTMYKLTDDNLYDTIVMKYMSGMGAMNDSKTNSSKMQSHDQTTDMSKMEGM